MVTGNEYFLTECYLESRNKNYKAVLQARNLIIYNTQTGASVLSFSFNDAYLLPCRLVIQGDRNLVIYHNSKPLWTTYTDIFGLNKFFILKLEDSGTMSISNSSNLITLVTTSFKLA